MTANKISKVFISCNQEGDYSVIVRRGNKDRHYNEDRYYHVDPSSIAIDMLSSIGSYNREFKMTAQLSIYPTVSIRRVAQESDNDNSL